MTTAGIHVHAVAELGGVIDVARQADRLGFSKCWVLDHGLSARDVFVTLGAIAENTESIHIGPGVTNPYTRHPAQTAAAIATIDERSGGRAFLGLGAGGTLVLNPMGLERRKPVTSLREMIETSRALFRGERVNYSGETIHLDDAHLDFARPDLPIWIASRGEKILTLAGARADGVELNFLHRDLLGNYVDIVRRGAAVTGNDPKLCYTIILITTDDMFDRMRPYMLIPLIDSPPEAKDLIGISPDEVDLIRQTMFSEGLSAAGQLLKEEWVRPFVVMGSPKQCASELSELTTRHGFDEISVNTIDLEAASEVMQQLADVMKLLA